MVSVCFTGRPVGVFDVSVDFREASLDITDTGCNTASLDLFFGGQILNVVRQECEDGGHTVGVWTEPQEFWEGLEVTDTGGFLRVTRSAENVVTAYFNETEIHSQTYNGAAVTELCMTLGNHLSLDAVSVRFDDFVLTADAIEDPTGQWREVIATGIAPGSPPNDGSSYTALGFHPDGNEVAIAYTEVDTKELKVVRGAWNGVVWIWQPPEVAAPEGRGVDLAYDACGNLWLSFMTGGSKAKVKVAHWDGASWTELQVGSGANRWVTSIAHDPAQPCGPPSVTYGADAGNQGHVMFVEGELPPVAADTGSRGTGGGDFSAIAYNPAGQPSCVYSYSDDAGLRWVRFADRDAAGVWHPQLHHTVMDGMQVLREMSLAYQDATPVLVYTNAQYAPLVFCERPDTWSCSELWPGSSGGWDWGFVSNPSIMVDGAGTVIVGAHVTGLNYDPELWIFRRAEGEEQWEVERIWGFSAGDGALDPNGNPAFSYRCGTDICFVYLDTGGCTSAAQCDDGNQCTTDSCIAGSCSYGFLSDGSPCGGPADICCLGQCVTPACEFDLDCDDGDECTVDQCLLPANPCASYCEHDPIPDCGCVPTHSKEKGPRCADGLDNDCDGLKDGEDPDC
jgi:hypothetical protein